MEEVKHHESSNTTYIGRRRAGGRSRWWRRHCRQRRHRQFLPLDAGSPQYVDADRSTGRDPRPVDAVEDTIVRWLVQWPIHRAVVALFPYGEQSVHDGIGRNATLGLPRHGSRSEPGVVSRAG